MAQGGSVTIKAILDASGVLQEVQRIKSELASIGSGGLDDVDAAAGRASAALGDTAQKAQDADAELSGMGSGGLQNVASDASRVSSALDSVAADAAGTDAALDGIDGGGLSGIAGDASRASAALGGIEGDARAVDGALDGIDGGGLSGISGDASRAESALGGVEAAAKEADSALDGIGADGMSGLQDAIGGVSDALGGLGGPIGDAIGGLEGLAGAGGKLNPVALGATAVATATVAVGTAAFTVAADYEGATSRIQAALGTTADEAERFGEIAENVFESGWGESIDEVADTLITVKERIRDLDDDGLKYVTEGVQVMAETFGADVGESVRGVNVLMEAFGLSAQEATDLMAAGMQNGLNFSDELGDNLAEYAGRWADAGVSASDYFSMLQAGCDNGAYSLDKVGDFLNEFLTSLSDGRLEENINMFSEGTQKVFDAYKNGGATAQDVLNACIGDMQNMTSETDRAALASELWSSLGEDNAWQMIAALAGVEDSYGEVTGAAEELGEAAGSDVGSKWEATCRRIQGALEPLGSALTGVASQALDGFNGILDWAGQAFADLWPTIQPFVQNIQDAFQKIGETVSPIFDRMKQSLDNLTPLFQLLATVVGGALYAAFTVLMGILGAVAGAFEGISQTIEGVTGIIGGFVQVVIGIFTGNTELIRQGAQMMWDGIGQTLQGVIDTAVGAVTGFIDSVFAMLGLPPVDWQAAWENIKQFFSDLWNSISSTASDLWNTITSNLSSAWNGISSTASSIFDGVKNFFSDTWTNIQNTAQSIWDGISGSLSSIWDGISSSGQSIFDGLASALSGIWDDISSTASSIWNGIKDTLTNLANGAKDSVTNAANSLKDGVTNAFNGAKDAAINAFNSLKDGISNAINTAKDTVSNAVNAIKGFFSNLTLRLPSIQLPPLPHFTISGSFSLNPPSVPSIGVSWYATGGIFDKASVIGVGEAGPEAVLPLSGHRMRPFAQEVASEMGGSGGTYNVTFNIEGTVREEADVERIARECERRMRMYERAKGR